MANDIVLPIGTLGNAANEDALTSQGSGDTNMRSALPVLSLGIRTGAGDTPLGYTQSIARTHTRKVEAVYQLEPYADGTFKEQDASLNAGVNANIQDALYWPGERIEVVPGPITDEKVKLGRTALYSSSLFEALMRANIGPSQKANINDNTGGVANHFVTALQQVRPFQIYEIYVSPLNGDIFWGIKYVDCFATAIPRSVKRDDTTIMEEIDFEVTRSRFYEALTG